MSHLEKNDRQISEAHCTNAGIYNGYSNAIREHTRYALKHSMGDDISIDHGRRKVASNLCCWMSIKTKLLCVDTAEWNNTMPTTSNLHCKQECIVCPMKCAYGHVCAQLCFFVIRPWLNNLSSPMGWTTVCRLSGAKPLSKPTATSDWLQPREKIPRKSHRN